MHINDDEILKAQDFTFQSLLNGDEIKSSYGEQIKTFFKIIVYDHVWQNKGTFSKRSLIIVQALISVQASVFDLAQLTCQKRFDCRNAILGSSAILLGTSYS